MACKGDALSVRKLLLQLTGQTTLNLVKGLELRHGNENDNGLFAALDIYFLDRTDLQGSQLGPVNNSEASSCTRIQDRLEVLDIVLQV